MLFQIIGDHQSLIYLLMPWDWSTLGWLSKYSNVHEKNETSYKLITMPLSKILILLLRNPGPEEPEWAVRVREEQCRRKDLPAFLPLQRPLAALLLTLCMQLCLFCLLCWRFSQVQASVPSSLSSSYIKQTMSESVPNKNMLPLCPNCCHSTFICFAVVFRCCCCCCCFWTTAAAPDFPLLPVPPHEVRGQSRPLKRHLWLCCGSG